MFCPLPTLWYHGGTIYHHPPRKPCARAPHDHIIITKKTPWILPETAKFEHHRQSVVMYMLVSSFRKGSTATSQQQPQQIHLFVVLQRKAKCQNVSPASSHPPYNIYIYILYIIPDTVQGVTYDIYIHTSKCMILLLATRWCCYRPHNLALG